MKRSISLLLCLVLVVSTFCSQITTAIALESSATITVSDKNCHPGDDISLSVSLSDNPGMMYLQVTPKFINSEDAETDYLTIDSVENGEIFSSVTKDKNLVFVSNSNITDNGTICTMNITVSEDTPVGKYIVELIFRECYNSSEQDIPVNITVGTVTVAHTQGDAVNENMVAATCTQKGSYDKVIYCTVCDEELSREAKVQATTGHTEKTLSAVAPTCTKTGLTAGKKCSKCGTIIVKQNVVAKKAHTLVTIPAKAATYTATGLTAGKKCSVCNTVTVAQQTIAKLAKKSLKKAKITVKAQTYTGKTLKPSITVKLGSKTLKNKVDYTVSYKNNKNIGKATVSITGKGAYKDSAKTTFVINPKKVGSLKAKAGKKQMTASWKKDTSVGGYEIVYATNSKFSSAKKTLKVASAQTTKKVIKKLKSKTTYYVKIRAFKKADGKTLYGDYSKTVKVKIK